MRYFTLLPLVALLGCSSPPEIIERPVYITRTVVLTVPDYLLKTNGIPKPPAKDLYLNSDWSGKEGLLFDYSKTLLKSLKYCEADKQSIQELLTLKKSLYPEAKVD